MNKILKSLLLIALMAITMTGCREDAELADTGAQGNPEKEVIGTYNGTFFVSLEENTTEYEGSITITETGRNIGMMHISCPGRKIDVDVAVNIMKQNPNYRFYNEINTNPLGASFAGAITPDGTISMNFKKVERQGRTSYVFYYEFDGKR